jgi:hypothetical protein
MKTFLILLGLLSLLIPIAKGQQKQLNIPAIHQLVSQSQTEYDRQTDARNKQSLVSANEKANLTLLTKMKVKYRELQQRFNTLGTAINAANIGLNAVPIVDQIVNNQEQIISMARKNPALIAIGYDAELTFVSKAKGLISYVAGLVIAIGDVNQMKASDRKILFDYVLSELSYLQQLSANMRNMMVYADLASMLRAATPFRDYINADVHLAGEVIRNARYLTQ